MTSRIAVVDDDGPMRAFVRRNLEARDHEVLEAANGMEALALLRHERVDLVILDIMMPHLDGYETCRRIREFTDVPVIVLTAMGDERDIVAALDCGADDYLTKPFGVEELLARIRSVLRRVTREIDTEPSDEIVHRDLKIDMAANRAWLGGEQLDLTRTEFTVLRYYAQNLGRTVPHKQVLLAVWGEGYENESHYVRIYVSRLRAKVEQAGSGEPYFATEHGLGYRLG
jgi:two-component system KDP operon response regulator KdpE